MAEVSDSEAESYRVLGIRPGASPEEVRRAYRRQAMLNHPDRNPGDAAAEKRFREILEAHQVVLRSMERNPNRSGPGSGPSAARPVRPQRGPVRRHSYRSSASLGKFFGRLVLFGIFTLGPMLLILFIIWANTTTDWLRGCCWEGRDMEDSQTLPERESRNSPPLIFRDFSRWC